MQLPQFHLAELLLAVVFIGLFIALAVRIWGDYMFITVLAMVGVPLFLGYFLLIIMMRQHRDQREGNRRGLG